MAKSFASLPKLEEWPKPIENPHWIGQENAEQTLLQAYASSRLPHGWLITGEEGVGKATLAYRFARFLLSDKKSKLAKDLYIEPSDPAFKKVAAGGHNDLKVITAGENEKKKTDAIGVEDIRALLPFMRLTAGQEGWRIIIIDGADSMNRNAQNALLKILEEPGEHSIIMLLAENAGSLLPTIRSRCRVLRLENENALPAELFDDLTANDRAILYFLCRGLLGKASRFLQEDGGKHYNDALVLLMEHRDAQAMHKLGDIYAKSGNKGWDWFTQSVQTILFARIKNQPVPDGMHLPSLPTQNLIQLYDDIAQMVKDTDQFYLDKKQTILTLAERLRS